MEQLFNQFMHIYFWVYIAGVLFLIINNYDKKSKGTLASLNTISIIGFVLFIMSFKY